MTERKIIPFPNQDHKRAILDIAYNRTVEKYNKFEKIAKFTPALIVASLISGTYMGWQFHRWFEENKDYLR